MTEQPPPPPPPVGPPPGGYPPPPYGPGSYGPGSYGPGWYGPGWYGPGGYGPYGPQPRTAPEAIVALVCAGGSFVVFPLVPAIVALVLVGRARRQIAESGGALTGDGLLLAARILAWVNIGLCVLAVLAVLAVGALVAVTGTNSVG